MATEKTRSHVAAGAHAIAYTLPFAFITWSSIVLLLICVTHFIVDRWRLARFVV